MPAGERIMDRKKLSRFGIGLGIVIGLVLVLHLFRTALTPVFAALLLAYLLDPVIDRMEARGLKRTTSILILAGLAVVVAGGLSVFLIIQVQRELVSLYHNFPGYLERIQHELSPLLKDHLGLELPATIEDALTGLKGWAAGLDLNALKPASLAAGRVFSSALALLGWLVSIGVIPVFLFYFLRDWDRIKVGTLDYIPVPYRDYVKDKAVKIDELLGAFIRGQLTICLILGLLYSLGLLMVGLDLAVVIGMGAGIALIVPYLGTALGLAAGSVMAILQFGLSWHLLAVWGVFTVVQLFESYFLTPRIMGDKVGLSPVWVIFALIAGADLLGLLGMLIAIPVAAITRVFILDALAKFKTTEFFQGDQNNHPGPVSGSSSQEPEE